jgi:hypothetical protein
MAERTAVGAGLVIGMRAEEAGRVACTAYGVAVDRGDIELLRGPVAEETAVVGLECKGVRRQPSAEKREEESCACERPHV